MRAFLFGYEMKSRIEIFIEFDFRGETFRPSALIDLDQLMEREGRISPFHPILAREGGIGPYSYELEVMETCPVQVAHAEGLAAEFVRDGHFDTAAFESAWHHENDRQLVRAIAARYFDAEELQQRGVLEEALVAAYRLGKGESG